MTHLQAELERVLLLAESGRSEDYVREELILPVLTALGYGGGSIYSLERGHRLAGQRTAIQAFREHTLPDLVLRVLGIPVWIVEAKSTRGALGTKSHLRQISSYAANGSLGCRFALLTNGILYKAYRLEASGVLIPIGTFALSDLVRSANRRQAFIDLLEPAAAYTRSLDFDNLFRRYDEGTWPIRVLCMKRFTEMSKDPAQKRRLPELLPLWQGGNVRARVMPALTLLFDDNLGARVVEATLSDPHDAVRDTLYTIIRSAASQDTAFHLKFSIEDWVPSGWFSRVLYGQMLAAVLRNGDTANRRQYLVARKQASLLTRDRDTDVRYFAKLAEQGIVTPLPFAAFLSVPRFGTRQWEIQKRMVEVSLRQAVDDNYATESRESAVDAIYEAHLFRLPLIARGNYFLSRRSSSLMTRLLNDRSDE